MAPLEAKDLETLATAAYLASRDAESEAAWNRAHQAHLERGDREAAAGCALWLAFGLFHRGAAAPGGGWIARAGRLLEKPDTTVSFAAICSSSMQSAASTQAISWELTRPSSRLSRSHNGLGIVIWPGLRDMGEAVR